MVSRRVLIVEDSVAVLDALRILLEADGHQVSVAHSVADATERVLADRPDVMVLDLTLPDGDGLSVLSLVRDRTLSRPPATIALTGHADDATRERCLAAGCRAVLVKPMPTKALREAVRAVEIDRP